MFWSKASSCMPCCSFPRTTLAQFNAASPHADAPPPGWVYCEAPGWDMTCSLPPSIFRTTSPTVCFCFSFDKLSDIATPGSSWSCETETSNSNVLQRVNHSDKTPIWSASLFWPNRSSKLIWATSSCDHGDILSLTKMWDIPSCGQVLNTPYSTGSISWLIFIYALECKIHCSAVVFYKKHLLERDNCWVSSGVKCYCPEICDNKLLHCIITLLIHHWV
jgi:hypothetical protein